jgi:hypothetical protein
VGASYVAGGGEWRDGEPGITVGELIDRLRGFPADYLVGLGSLRDPAPDRWRIGTRLFVCGETEHVVVISYEDRPEDGPE